MDAYAAYPSLELDRPARHVLRLTLRAAGRLNAVSGAMHGELAAVWKTIDKDDETRAVIVRGADGAFSSGGDLDLVLEIANDPETRARVFHEARDLVYNVIDCSKPIVSAITGPAVGAGLAVGLLADISIATPLHGSSTATRSWASPPVITRQSSGRCSAASRRRSTTCCSASRWTGSRPSASGSSRSASPRTSSRQRALEIATRLAEGAQPAIRHTKLALNNWLRAAGPAFDASLALEFLDLAGPDVHEGVAAVREKRKPRFA